MVTGGITTTLVTEIGLLNFIVLQVAMRVYGLGKEEVELGKLGENLLIHKLWE
jgi:hypothetical protein